MKYITNHLEYKILVLITAVLILSFGTIFYLVSSHERNRAVSQDAEKSALLAGSLHRTIDTNMMSFKADIVRHLIGDLKTLEGVVRVQIVRGKDDFRKTDSKGTEEAFQDLKTIEEVNGRVPELAAAHPEWKTDHATKAVNVAQGVENPEFKRYFATFLKDLSEATNDETRMKIAQKDYVYFEDLAGEPVLTYLKPLPNFQRCFLCHGGDHKMLGVLMISTSMKSVNAETRKSQRYLLLISIGILLFLLLALKILMGRLVLIPVAEVVGHIQGIARGEGDLTQRLATRSHDEIGQFAQWFNLFVEKLQSIVLNVSNTSKQVTHIAQEVVRGTKEILEGSQIQGKAVETTSEAITAMSLSIQKVAENTDVLSNLSEESSSAIIEMAAAIGEIAKSSMALSDSVEATSTSIIQMSSSVKQISENVKVLASSADDTSSSMVRIDAATKQIRSNIHETVELSKKVTEDAVKGGNSVKLTMGGITRIKESSQQVFTVIHSLRGRAQDIGKILSVIDEVAEQTNLLALNAAIIAAQAGEHGKGFAVVAQEIKELAERTAASTQEIHQIINAVQIEARNAVETMNIGSKSVEEGVQLSKDAEMALSKILESSARSTERIREIANATDEQTSGVVQVTEAMRKIDDMARQIAVTSEEQNKETEQIIQTTEYMRQIAKKVGIATQEQSQGNQQITEIVEKVNKKVKEIVKATSLQTGESREIVRAVERIKEVTIKNVKSVESVGKAVEELIRQATSLANEISKFHV
ncbi:MAG TPA: HAMP domain-containing methyl-accepting chemotaxis protein [Nitrospiria bacterium]|nr:HAMP domain-containing methyl-accepting chemotaxis protein [Nitrospiria bacterium]